MGRSAGRVPDTIAFALAAVGFVRKIGDDDLIATNAGLEYLTARNIPTRKHYAPRT